MVGAAIAGSAVASVAGSALSAGAAGSAAKAQADAQLQAAQLQQQTAQQNMANLQPYNTTAQAQLPAYANYYNTTNTALNNASGLALQNIPNPAGIASAVQSSPAYQFNLGQGLQATQNSAASMGLGVSGASQKAAASYATGLANTYYQGAFNNAQSIYGDYQNNYQNALNTQTQTFNQLASPVSIGENAAAQAGNQAVTSSGLIGSNIAGAGTSTAAGITGQANAINSGLSSVGSSGLNYLAYNNALNNNGGQGSTGGSGSAGVDQGSWDTA